MSKHITPTVGRVMHFRPADRNTFLFNTIFDLKTQKAQPFVAHVCAVTERGSRVNLVGFDSMGRMFVREDVHVHQEGEDIPPGEDYVEWMPYQKSVAAGEIAPTLHATAGDRKEAS